jgi:16S rRNA (cytosine967-C5)-methyltransferase
MTVQPENRRAQSWAITCAALGSRPARRSVSPLVPRRERALTRAVSAARALQRVADDDAFADLALDAEITAHALTTRDAALATELVYGTLRWQRYLDWILAPHSRRALPSLDTRVLVLLRMTAYQLVFLERIPSFAAVSDAVSLAKGRGKPGTPEFVNAVLRSFSRRGARSASHGPPTMRSTRSPCGCRFPRGWRRAGSSATAPTRRPRSCAR